MKRKRAGLIGGIYTEWEEDLGAGRAAKKYVPVGVQRTADRPIGARRPTEPTEHHDVTVPPTTCDRHITERW